MFTMRYKVLASFFFLLPFLAMAQTAPDWHLYLNKTKLLSSTLDSVVAVQLPKEGKGTLTVCLAKKDTSLKRTVLLMNDQRQTFLQKAISPGARAGSFSMAEVLKQSGAKPFTIYLVAIPADPAKAMLVRMAPAAICKVDWR